MWAPGYFKLKNWMTKIGVGRARKISNVSEDWVFEPPDSQHDFCGEGELDTVFNPMVKDAINHTHIIKPQ